MCKITFFLLILITFICLIFNFDSYFFKNVNDLPVIVWWTNFTGISEFESDCKVGKCRFTHNREYFENFNASAILFYGSDFNIEDLPLPQHKDLIWGLLHEESPKNQPIFNHFDAISLFNITSTFKSVSNVPLTLQYLRNIDSITTKEYFMSTTKKNLLLKNKNISPIIYLQSDCNPPSMRDDYIKELGNYIAIDSYGSCLNNCKLPEYLKGIENVVNPKLLEFFGRYKFSLAFENYACEDYITEKLWRPIIAGSVPIYWGSPTVPNWIPNEKSIINVRKFKSPKELAYHLKLLLENDDFYEEHLEHKTFMKISNKVLLNTMKKRFWKIDEDQLFGDNFVDAFECFVCDLLWERKSSSHSFSIIADQSHYGCPLPETPLKSSYPLFWIEQWEKSKIEAKVLKEIVENNKTLIVRDFDQKVLDSLQDNKYFQNHRVDL